MFLDEVKPCVSRGPAQLRYLYLSLSNLCDARCIYCDVHETVEKFPRHDANFFETLLRDAHEMGVRHVHFLGGGEPLIDPQFPVAARFVRELGMKFVITTNGSTLLSRLENELSGAQIGSLVVSLDSHEQEQHDAVRGKKGLFAKAVSGIEKCLADHPEASVVINHVVTEVNISKITAFLEFARDLGVTAVNLIPVKDSDMLDVSGEQRKELERVIATLLKRPGEFPELLFDQSEMAEWIARADGGSTDRVYRCHFPKRALYLDLATGNAYPCDCTVHRAPEERFQLGNIRDQSLSSIWQGPQIADLREVLESPEEPGCKRDCDWNNIRTNRMLAGLAEEPQP